MEEGLNLGAINKKYKYGNIETVDQYIEAEKYIDELVNSKIYYSYNAEKRRKMVHRFQYSLKRIEDKELFFKDLVNSYFANLSGALNVDKLEEVQYLKTNQGIRKIVKHFEEFQEATNKKRAINESENIFIYAIEYDTLTTTIFKYIKKEERLKVHFQIQSPIPFEPFSMKSLTMRTLFKKNSRKFNKQVKKAIKERRI